MMPDDPSEFGRDSEGSTLPYWNPPDELSMIPQCVCSHLITHHNPRAFPPRICTITNCKCTHYLARESEKERWGRIARERLITNNPDKEEGDRV